VILLNLFEICSKQKDILFFRQTLEKKKVFFTKEIECIQQKAKQKRTLLSEILSENKDLHEVSEFVCSNTRDDHVDSTQTSFVRILETQVSINSCLKTVQSPQFVTAQFNVNQASPAR
jgi:hypothetical protein